MLNFNMASLMLVYEVMDNSTVIKPPLLRDELPFERHILVNILTLLLPIFLRYKIRYSCFPFCLIYKTKNNVRTQEKGTL